MLQNWNFAKERQHDTSGITNPHEWTWRQDEHSGIYYPAEKAAKSVHDNLRQRGVDV